MVRLLMALAASLAVLAGCVNDRAQHIDDDFGNAVRHNIALQTIDPQAGGDDGSDSIDGQRAAQAVERMREASPQVDDASLLDDLAN